MEEFKNIANTKQQNRLKNNTYKAGDEIYKILVEWWFKTEKIAETNSDIKKYLDLINSWEIEPLNEGDGMGKLLEVLRKMNPWIEIKGDPTQISWILFCENREELKLPIWFYIAKWTLRTKHNTKNWMYCEYRITNMEEANSWFYELI